MEAEIFQSSLKDLETFSIQIKDLSFKILFITMSWWFCSCSFKQCFSSVTQKFFVLPLNVPQKGREEKEWENGNAVHCICCLQHLSAWAVLLQRALKPPVPRVTLTEVFPNIQTCGRVKNIPGFKVAASSPAADLDTVIITCSSAFLHPFPAWNVPRQ